MSDQTPTDTPIEQHETTIDQEETNENEIVFFEVKIITPQKHIVSIQLTEQDIVQDIKQNLFETGETSYLTNYHLELEGVVLFDFLPLAEIEGIQDGHELVIVEDDYCSRTARFHVTRSLELFGLTEEHEDVVYRGIASAKNLDEGIRQSDVGDEAKLGSFFPAESKQASCIKSVSFSGWNPVPKQRRLLGDLFYLDVVTNENTTVCVTASVGGFFVNQTKGNNFEPTIKDERLFSHALPDLIRKISNSFSANFEKSLERNLTGSSYDNMYIPIKTPSWLQRPLKHTFNNSRAEQSLLDIQQVEHNIQGHTREWNAEIQAAAELSNESIDERVERSREMYRIHCDFVEEALKGAVEIIDGNVPSIQPVEDKLSEMYIYNNIFFSYAVDGRNFFPDNEPDYDSYKKASNDILGVKAFNALQNPELHTLGTVVVDYRGYRLVAQSIIPGLFSEKSESDSPMKLAYGSLDNNTLECDPEFDQAMEKAAQSLYIKKRTVRSKDGNEVTLHSQGDIKGIVGEDKRKYILDVNRTFPRDANYQNPETHSTALIRSELIEQYILHINEPEETETTDNTDNTENTEETKAPVERKIEPVYFNTDLLTKIDVVNPDAEDMKLLEEIAAFLITKVENFVEDAANFSLIVSDGDTLKDALHVRGINMRYLGRIAKLAESKCVYLYKLALTEMISRATKGIFDTLLRGVEIYEVSDLVSSLLNCFFGRLSTSNRPSRSGVDAIEDVLEMNHNTMWSMIRQSVQAKYDFEIPEMIPAYVFQLPTLRSICKRNGIQIYSGHIDLTKAEPFTPEMISDIVPNFKHSFSFTGDCHALLEAGKRVLLMKQYHVAYNYLQESLALFHQIYGPMQTYVADCFSWLAKLLFFFGNPLEAIENQENALVIYERVLGPDHYETATAYLTLAQYYAEVEGSVNPVNLQKRGLYLLALMSGSNSPEMATNLVSLGMLVSDTGKDVMEYFVRALTAAKSAYGERSGPTAQIYHSLAIFHNARGELKEALKCEKENYDILKAITGENDMRFIESSIWLQQLTSTVNSKQEPVKNRKARTAKPQQQNIERDLEREIISQLPVSERVKYVNTGSSKNLNRWAKKVQNRKASVLRNQEQEETINIDDNQTKQTNNKRRKRRNKKKQN
eukprot:TRINITY_DN4705_c0_g1_i1.p1 TRINITY_DN4705_c0_g1~~TRINITY_DN4705_c0_g1_i1.p1  ORF type:complete len:1138 (-),score=337.68 TRINITY_DN4705_c0_g1_i1:9-3422(-)